MGRKIFGVLILTAVISLFVKVSFLNNHVEMGGKRKEGAGLLILQTFKDDWAMAQRAITETQASMPKRVLERISVSETSHLNSFSFSFWFSHPLFDSRENSENRK